MKRILNALTIFAAVLTGCSNEVEEAFTSNEVGQVNTITATADEFQGETRTTISKANYSVAWKSGDAIGIFPLQQTESSQIAFKIKNGAGTNSGTFDGMGWGLKDNVQYAAYYPHVNDGFQDWRSIPIDYTEQVQSANDNTDHLGKYDYMWAMATPADGALNFQFKHIGTLVHFQLTMPEKATLLSLTLSSKTPWGVLQKGSYSLQDGSLDDADWYDYIDMGLNNITVSSGGTLDAYMMIYPGNYPDGAPEVSVISTDDIIYTASVKGFEAEQGKVVTVSGKLEKQRAAHEYVDLGTVVDGNKVLWATTNLGADNPWEYGGYYAWGETKAYGEEDTSNAHNYAYGNTYTKTYYDFCTYKWATGDSWTTISKYSFADGQISAPWYSGDTYIGLNGVKNQTTLDPADDAATANWGNGWRMPTAAELEALLDNCYWQWVTTYSGKSVSGYIVYKAKTAADKGKINSSSSASYSGSDAHIFLPAAGYRNDGNFYVAGSYGYYWLSELYDNSDDARILGFYSGFVFTNSYGYRCNGQSVRPVRLVQN